MHSFAHYYKSLMQTVLITASGPQALNALVHRTRYTQGSRQNRCVSLREALALRANASGPGWTQANPATTLVVLGLAPCAQRGFNGPRHCTSPSRAVGATPLRGAPKHFFFNKNPNCHLRTAYGGESNCIIKT